MLLEMVPVFQFSLVLWYYSETVLEYLDPSKYAIQLRKHIVQPKITTAS
jgi:hypothetical protein